MSRKNNLLKFKVVTQGDMTGSVTSAVTNIQHLDNIGYQMNITSGTPTGAFSVEVSADYYQDPEGTVVNAGNWVALTLTPTPSVTTGAPANIYLDLNQLSAPWIRLKWTHSGGTGGVFDAFVTAKMV